MGKVGLCTRSICQLHCYSFSRHLCSVSLPGVGAEKHPNMASTTSGRAGEKQVRCEGPPGGVVRSGQGDGPAKGTASWRRE